MHALLLLLLFIYTSYRCNFDECLEANIKSTYMNTYLHVDCMYGLLFVFWLENKMHPFPLMMTTTSKEDASCLCCNNEGQTSLYELLTRSI
jgi:hypothetical protein